LELNAVIAAEAAVLAAAYDDVFGFAVLQLGIWGSGRELLTHCRIRHQTVAAARPGPSVDLVCLPGQLPLAGSSIDAVLLPHVLEFADDPHALLLEADRVLVSEGQLLILGFNPRSAWGWRMRGNLRSLSEGRVRDWLTLLRYEIAPSRHYLSTWPLPWPAGAWLLKARKRLYGLTPIRPRKRERRTVLASALEPSA
jgi:SAM-dependent methyltransferase